MKLYTRIFFTFLAVVAALSSFSQQHSYSMQESLSIQDSIKKSRWDIGGSLSKYAFRYMSEFFPVGIINGPTDAASVRFVPKKSIEDLQVVLKSGTIGLHEYLNRKHIASFIVVHKGTVVYEKYNSMNPGDQHTLQSISKVVTATLITSLINEGRINVDDPIEKYLSELKGSDWTGITVRNILHMRTGMDSRSIDFSTGPFSNPKHKNYGLESALGILPGTPETPASPYDFIKGLKKEKPSGQAAEYSNINTFVLGWLAEKVTGKKFNELVAERIWQPMGASSNAYVCLSANGIPWHHGGISATLRDLAKFGTLFTNSEIRKRKESLISFQQLKEIFDTKPIENSPEPFKWAYQWDLASDGIMMKGGFGGQALYIHPEKDIVIAYYNYIDKDWGIMNMISEKVLKDVINAAEY